MTSLSCGPVDLVHVDGDHSYNGCLHDLRLAAEIGRWVLVDDLDWQIPVRAAVTAFLEETRYRAIELPTVRGDMLIEVRPREKTFSHGGDTGDLIYALPTVKMLGGGRLRLVKAQQVREPFSPAKVESLRPLLEAQPYVSGVEYGEEATGLNLDAFRRLYRDDLNLSDLVSTTFGVPHYPREEPWLFCSDPRPVARVVINRSAALPRQSLPLAPGPGEVWQGGGVRRSTRRARGLAECVRTGELLPHARLVGVVPRDRGFAGLLRKPVRPDGHRTGAVRAPNRAGSMPLHAQLPLRATRRGVRPGRECGIAGLTDSQLEMRVLDMTIGRVALIYDDRPRPETTGVYCRRALEHLVEVTHFRPDELSARPTQGFDLYLNIDDGLRYHLPAELHPCAWWAIDTHMNFGWCLEKARRFDLVFAAQRDGTDQLRRAGIDSAVWLPLACDPEIHRKHDVPKRFDVAFVGNVFPGPRAELLDLIRRKYPNSFLGQAYFDEMARTYSAARMAFNRSIKNDVNMRVFEAIACGSLLVTNDLADNGQAELFRDGVHLATYREPEELLDKLAFYLERESIRERIAAAGRSEAIEKHTYRHRMERLLSEAEAGLSRVVVGGARPRSQNLETCGQARGRGRETRRAGGHHHLGRPARAGPTAGSGDPRRALRRRLRLSVLRPAPADERTRSVLLRPCPAGGDGPGPRRGAKDSRHRLRCGPAGRGDQGSSAGRGRRHRARRGSCGGRPAERLDEVSVGDVERIDPEFARRLVRRDRLRRYPGAPPRPGSAACTRRGRGSHPTGG